MCWALMGVLKMEAFMLLVTERERKVMLRYCVMSCVEKCVSIGKFVHLLIVCTFLIVVYVHDSRCCNSV